MSAGIVQDSLGIFLSTWGVSSFDGVNWGSIGAGNLCAWRGITGQGSIRNPGWGGEGGPISKKCLLLP